MTRTKVAPVATKREERKRRNGKLSTTTVTSHRSPDRSCVLFFSVFLLFSLPSSDALVLHEFPKNYDFSSTFVAAHLLWSFRGLAPNVQTRTKYDFLISTFVSVERATFQLEIHQKGILRIADASGTRPLHSLPTMSSDYC